MFLYNNDATVICDVIYWYQNFMDFTDIFHHNNVDDVYDAKLVLSNHLKKFSFAWMGYNNVNAFCRSLIKYCRLRHLYHIYADH